MKTTVIRFLLLVILLNPSAMGGQPNLAVQNENLFEKLRQVHHLDDKQMTEIRQLFRKSRVMSQGNPAITRHPANEQSCEEKLHNKDISYENEEYEEICGSRYMAPLYDPETGKPTDAVSCIDRFEFPNIPCAYPVVWVRAREAALLCEIMGKRLCDAHEWEGACEGRLLPPDYDFDIAEKHDPKTAIRMMRKAHNQKYAGSKSWSYGNSYEKGKCAADSQKSTGCSGGNWQACGSNTYPSGFFPECRSGLYVHDLHGNAAEHMNLPLSEDQMASNGSKELGYTEMKGSWFIFDRYYAHQDWCRWRAPFWHGSRVMDKHSHHNYHLGFRCCKTVNKKTKQEKLPPR